jgi:hypothetical protein
VRRALESFPGPARADIVRHFGEAARSGRRYRGAERARRAHRALDRGRSHRSPRATAAVIRDGFDADVDRWRAAHGGARATLADLETRERRRIGMRA